MPRIHFILTLVLATQYRLAFNTWNKPTEYFMAILDLYKSSLLTSLTVSDIRRNNIGNVQKFELSILKP